MKQPPIGLLMSMALRFDHGLALPGYYDQPLFASEGITHKQRLESTINQMRQLWEEVAGEGFYKPEYEDVYAAKYREVMEK